MEQRRLKELKELNESFPEVTFKLNIEVVEQTVIDVQKLVEAIRATDNEMIKILTCRRIECDI